MDRNKQVFFNPADWKQHFVLGFQAEENTHLPRNRALQVALLYLTSLLLLSSCAATVEPSSIPKIEGISLEAPSRPSEEDVMSEVIEQGASHVCLMPYAFVRADGAEVLFDMNGSQWWGERSEGIQAMTDDAHSKGLGVFLKPHLWLGHGSYTGELSFDVERDQVQWENSYRDYIMSYARLAEAHNVEIFCIGTELCTQVQSRPTYWDLLIDSVRAVYTGKLTYAANWDCYADFPFWKKLDYIGIDAYFPLQVKDGGEEGRELWTEWKVGMKQLSDSLDTQVLFTEYGYRSVAGGLAQPWITGRDGVEDQEVMSLGYRALYAEVWDEDWFAGGFLWKWHCKEHMERRDRSTDYSPQGKPALEIIRKKYGAQSLKKEE